LLQAVMFWTLALLLCPTLCFGGPSPRPLVIWHGLGDSYASPGMVEFVSMIQDLHPNIFVHSVYIDKDDDQDKEAGFYGNVNEQIHLVSLQLAGIPELRHGFDAIGFSQGGQFLRAFVERYNSPPVHNLLTFGSQHMGISDIPVCRPFDLLCQAARRVAKSAAYSTWAQANLVQAQYFRDPANLKHYLAANHFLPSINNEDPLHHNQTFAENLASLNALVLIMFARDRTVVPKESSWFGSEIVDDTNRFSGQQVLRPTFSRSVIPMHLQPLYIEDLIGLRTLDEQGRVIRETCDGEHMQISDCWEDFVREWTGELLDLQ
jgi:palmitoyl-protein thioesterase